MLKTLQRTSRVDACGRFPCGSLSITRLAGSCPPHWAPLRAETNHVQEVSLPRGSCWEKEHLKHRGSKLQVAVRPACGSGGCISDTCAVRTAPDWHVAGSWMWCLTARFPGEEISFSSTEEPLRSESAVGQEERTTPRFGSERRDLERRRLPMPSRLVPFVMPSQRARRRTEIKQENPLLSCWSIQCQRSVSVTGA